MPDPGAVTRILSQVEGGDPEALDRLLPLVYDDLKAIARRLMRSERAGHTLNPTAVVHEAYMKLAGLDNIEWQGRAHFFGAAASAMRRILVSYARARNAAKRGAGEAPLSLDDVVLAAHERPADFLELDEALERLGAIEPRQMRVVECRFFAGMDLDATAVALGVSNATVRRDWTRARAWLNRELRAGTG
ncbi:MAG: sigma-70 family RNA polymerase sigma factor [Longimicrobiales bacterium]